MAAVDIANVLDLASSAPSALRDAAAIAADGRAAAESAERTARMADDDADRVTRSIPAALVVFLGVIVIVTLSRGGR